MRRIFRILVLLHRYLGIAMCLLFSMWFASGIVMLFVPYPELTSVERFNGMAPLNLSNCCVSPAVAYAQSGLTELPERMRLVMVLGRPVFQLQPWDGATVSVFADTGEPMPPLNAQQAENVARLFSDTSRVRYVELSDYDQWTVTNGLDAQRPFYRVVLGDTAGTELYISQRSGEVVRDTTAFERGWNYVGSVSHWIYPTVLRKNWVWWDRVVWYGSLVGIVVALSGSILGITRLSFRKPYPSGRRSPFTGWMYWHHMLGVICALFVLTWIFSGWLSMDHGRLFAKPDPSRAERERFVGGAFNPALFGIPSLALEGTAAKEIEFRQIAGDGFYRVLFDAQRQQMRSVNDRTIAGTEFDVSLLTRASQLAFGSTPMLAADRLDGNDAYHYTTDASVPAPMLRIRFDDAAKTWLHVDPVAGNIVEKVDSSRRWYRWLFSGLHRFDFPYLVARPGLRQTCIVILCALGFVFSLTGAVIAYRRLARDLFSLRAVLQPISQ